MPVVPQTLPMSASIAILPRALLHGQTKQIVQLAQELLVAEPIDVVEQRGIQDIITFTALVEAVLLKALKTVDAMQVIAMA